MRLAILGGGQLGRMLTLAAIPLGVRCRVLDPAADAPAAVAAEHVRAAFDDESAWERLADGCDALTYEFENVDATALDRLAGRVPVRPGPLSLRTSRDRLAEKELFTAAGIAVPRWAAVDSEDDLVAAVAAVGLPALLKTRRMGYDGRGQRRLGADADTAAVRAAFSALGAVPCILEAVVPFRREIASLAVRGADGDIRLWPLVETRQRDGQLHSAIAPAPDVDPAVAAAVEAAHRRLLERLDHVGVLAVEWFDTDDGPVACETAPRVHNSGHWTIEGAVTSQFENHVRAVLGLPLGDTALTAPAVAMLNLIGTAPDAATVLAVPGAHLHLYGKEPRPARKLGHVTVLAHDAAERDALMESAARAAAPG